MSPPLGIDGGNITDLATDGVEMLHLNGFERVKREQSLYNPPLKEWHSAG